MFLIEHDRLCRNTGVDQSRQVREESDFPAADYRTKCSHHVLFRPAKYRATETSHGTSWPCTNAISLALDLTSEDLPFSDSSLREGFKAIGWLAKAANGELAADWLLRIMRPLIRVTSTLIRLTSTLKRMSVRITTTKSDNGTWAIFQSLPLFLHQVLLIGLPCHFSAYGPFCWRFVLLQKIPKQFVKGDAFLYGSCWTARKW